MKDNRLIGALLINCDGERKELLHLIESQEDISRMGDGISDDMVCSCHVDSALDDISDSAHDHQIKEESLADNDGIL